MRHTKAKRRRYKARRALLRDARRNVPHLGGYILYFGSERSLYRVFGRPWPAPAYLDALQRVQTDGATHGTLYVVERRPPIGYRSTP